MQFSKKATSLIEAMIIVAVVSLGVVGVYDFLISSERLAANTGQRITAIQISKEGIEAVSNIRNTNWLLFGADYQNCWNVQSYNINCIGDTGTTYDIAPGSYIVGQNTEFRWHLDGKPSSTYGVGNYNSDYGVEVGSGGFYTQDVGGISNPFYTREIIISYPEYVDIDGNTIAAGNSNNEKMRVTSLVQWGDYGQHKVELSHTLTNWKNKN